MLLHASWIVLAFVILAHRANGQIGGDGSDGVLDVTSTTILTTDTRPNGFQFQSITVRRGAALLLTGSLPAWLRSQGAVQIDGIVSADGGVPFGGPGGYHGGAPGMPGSGPGGGMGGLGNCQIPAFAFGGAHATAAYGNGSIYGSSYPFDVRGGSGGGGVWHPNGCIGGQVSGGGGGGTIVLLADGAISVTGTVSARGGASRAWGSGGSILLRTVTSLTVSGNVTAIGSGAGLGEGFVRLDASVASVTGRVEGVSLSLALPRLSPGPLAVGQSTAFRMDAIVGDTVFLFGAAAGASVPLPPWGTLLLDPSTLMLLGQSSSALQATTEAWATVRVGVPNNPALRGAVVHLQPFAVAPSLGRARLGNSLTVQIQ